VVTCLEQGADLHMAQLMPRPLTPGQRAVKRVCVCIDTHFDVLFI